MLTLPLDRPHPLRPPPAYADLPPVTRVRTPDGPAWLVTGFDPVAAVLIDPAFGLNPPDGPHPDNNTLFQDGDPHARLRRLVSPAFTPRRIGALREHLHTDAARLVGQMLDAGPTADLVEAVSAPLAIGAIGRLLGVPITDIRRFRDTVGAALTDISGDGWTRMQDFATEQIEAKRATPDDALLSVLIRTHDADDGRLTDAELVAMSTLLVVAGYLPMASAIAIGAIVLLDTGHLADLADPARREPAVEEVLRYQSGIGGDPFPRWARRDTELAGVSISSGDLVLVRLEAAHRDPNRFPDPYAFDPDRTAGHLAFGRGPHHCLGAALARLGLGATLGALAERAPTLRLAVPVGEIEWQHVHPDFFPTAVPVTWSR